MAVELKKGGRSTLAQVLEPDSEYAKTDFGPIDRARFVTEKIRLISKTDNPSISYGSVFDGYLILTSEDKDFLVNPDKIKIVVRDSHMKKHAMEVDFTVQRKKYDPLCD